MFNGLKLAAGFFLVLFALGALLISAPAVDQGDLERSPPLSFMAPGDEMAPAAAVNPAFQSPTFMVLQLPYANSPAASSVPADPLAAFFVRDAYDLGNAQIAILYYTESAIAARCRPVSINGKHARGLDPLKYI